jgi:hypothetical protein
MVMVLLRGGGDEGIILGSLMFWIYVSNLYNTKGWRMSHEHDFVKDLDGQVTCTVCGATDDAKDVE